MLTDLIATALAFIVVILLLSLVVTGITQLITATFRMRVRNLRRALTILINDLKNGGNTRKDVRPLVDKTIDAANFGTLNAPTDMKAGLGLIRLTWIKNEDLVRSLKIAGVPMTAENAKKAERNYQLLEAYMEKRFALFARYITFVTALFVAILFQVSSTDLIRQLWTDADLRAKYVATADRLVGEEGDKYREAVAKSTVDMQTIALEALDEISKKYEEEAGAFEEFSGKAGNEVDAREELSDILKDSPKRDEILAEYEKALDRRLSEAQQRGTVLTEDATAELAALDITPWRNGWDFYAGSGCLGLHWSRVLGVLLTALFLTFGAPFWFERLKDVARLRDAVSGKSGTDKDGKANKPNKGGDDSGGGSSGSSQSTSATRDANDEDASEDETPERPKQTRDAKSSAPQRRRVGPGIGRDSTIRNTNEGSDPQGDANPDDSSSDTDDKQK